MIPTDRIREALERRDGTRMPAKQHTAAPERRSVANQGKGSAPAYAPRWTIGVDPGIHGAIAILNPAGRVVEIEDMPILTRGKRKSVDAFEVDCMLLRHCAHDEVTIWIEDVNSHKQGATSAFTFGRGLGAIEALVLARRLALEYVTPAKWKKSAGLGRDKAASVDAVTRLYPEMADQMYGPKGGAKDGRAEAILIARYGWRLSRVGVQSDIEEVAA